MKAIILERRGDEAAVLCEDGTFLRTRRAGEVGETIELTAEVTVFPERRRNRWLRSAVAAMLALAITGGTLGYMGGTAGAYVSLDVEDSAIELTVNHFGRVIAVHALNDGTRELAERLDGEVRHHRTEEALDITMERLQDGGYLDGADSAVIAGVTTDNTRRAAELKELVTQSAERREQTAYVSEVSRAERRQAMEEQLSAGRFGFARDHGGKPPAEGRPEEAAHRPDADGTQKPDGEAEPSVPTSGQAENVQENPSPAESEAETRTEQFPPQQGTPPQERPNGWQDIQPQQHPDNGQETPPQERPNSWQDMQPQQQPDGGQETPPQERPDGGQETPPQERPDGGQETPPQERPDGGQETPPQERPDGGQETPPQERPDGGQETPPQQCPNGGQDMQPQQRPDGGQDTQPQEQPDGGQDTQPQERPDGGQDTPPQERPNGGQDAQPQQRSDGGQDMQPQQRPDGGQSAPLQGGQPGPQPGRR